MVVVKSNDLIQNSRYNLSLQEQKIILYCISRLKPTDTTIQEQEFDLKELCDICGIEYLGQNYKNFKSSIKKLADSSFWIQENGDDILCRWIESVRIQNKTKIYIKLSENLTPYLLGLLGKFTAYELGYTLVMKSKYSIRLYELLKSYSQRRKTIINLDNLKIKLQTAEYTVYNNFKVRVLDKAIEEINQYTDLIVSYTPIRESRKIVALEFTLDKKDTFESFYAFKNAERELDK